MLLIWKAFQNKENWCFPFWNIVFPFRSILYFCVVQMSKVIMSILGSSTKAATHRFKNISRKIKYSSGPLQTLPPEMHITKETKWHPLYQSLSNTSSLFHSIGTLSEDMLCLHIVKYVSHRHKLHLLLHNRQLKISHIITSWHITPLSN